MRMGEGACEAARTFRKSALPCGRVSLLFPCARQIFCSFTSSDKLHFRSPACASPRALQVTVAHVIAITWKQWEDTQPDTDSDFFGEYDERRA